jgi:C_GCAxxG_C_C family probable redox protein
MKSIDFLRRERALTIEKYAQDLFDGGWNCAESTVAALAHFLRFESSNIPRMATGFGGGMGRSKNLCGAVTGAVIAFGLLAGRDQPTDSKDFCYRAVTDFLAEFGRHFGSINCFELTGLDFNDPAGQEVYRQRIHAERCTHYVRYAVRCVLEKAQEAV